MYKIIFFARFNRDLSCNAVEVTEAAGVTICFVSHLTDDLILNQQCLALTMLFVQSGLYNHMKGNVYKHKITFSLQTLVNCL